MINFPEQSSEVMVLVCVLPRGVGGPRDQVSLRRVADDSANDGDERGWDQDSEQGKSKDLPRFCRVWIVAVVVRSNAAPPGSRREIEEQEAEDRTRKRKPSV